LGVIWGVKLLKLSRGRNLDQGIRIIQRIGSVIPRGRQIWGLEGFSDDPSSFKHFVRIR
jgi:hypothetical protein